MKVGVGIVLGLALCAGGAWWLLKSPADPAADPASATPSASAAASGGPAAVEAAPTPSDASGPPAAGSSAAKPIASAPFVDATPPGDVLAVTILDPDGRPVGGAEVHCTAWPKRDPATASRRNTPRVARTAAKAPGDDAPAVVELRADDAGVVAVPTRGGRVRVAARAGRLRGAATFSAGEEPPWVVRLKSGVAVEVFGADGAPAEDVLVAVKLSGIDDPFPGDGARCRTDRRGAAVFDGKAVRSAAAMGAVAVREHVGDAAPVLAAVIPGLKPAEWPTAPFPAKDDAAPVRLTLPPTGSLRVRVTDESGAPFREPTDVGVYAPDDSRAEVHLFGAADPAQVEAPVHVVRTRDGEATFLRAASGKLVVVAAPAGRDGRMPRVEITGPAPGAEAEATVKVAARGVLFRGRLLDAEERPLPFLVAYVDAEFEADAADDATRRTHVPIAPGDVEGAFAWQSDFPVTRYAGGKVVVTGYRAEGKGVARTLGAEFRMETRASAPDAEGVVDLGALRLSATNLLVAGTVVDEEGKPLVRANVSLRRRARSGEPAVVAGAFTADWRFGHGFVSTDRTGAFRRELPPAFDPKPQFDGQPALDAVELRVFAEADGRYDDVGTPFRLGESGVKVVAKRAGGFSGSFAPTTNASTASGLAVKVVGPAALPMVEGNRWSFGPGETEEREPPIEADVSIRNRSFAAKSLRPGPVRVEIRHEAVREPLFAVDLTIEAGVVAKDPRLQGIEVEKLLGLRRLTVHDEEGRPLREAEVHVRTGPGAWAEIKPDREGTAAVPARDAAPRVCVKAKGFQGVEIEALAADQIVVMKRLRPVAVRLQLPPGARAEAGLRRLTLSGTEAIPMPSPPADGAGVDSEAFEADWSERLNHPLRGDFVMLDFGANDVVVWNAAPGAKYRWAVYVRHPEKSDEADDYVDAGQVDAPTDVAETTVTLRLDPAHWARALGKAPPPAAKDDEEDDGDG